MQLDPEEAEVALLYAQWLEEMCQGVTEMNLAGDEKNEFIRRFIPFVEGEYLREASQDEVSLL